LKIYRYLSLKSHCCLGQFFSRSWRWKKRYSPCGGRRGLPRIRRRSLRSLKFCSLARFYGVN